MPIVPTSSAEISEAYSSVNRRQADRGAVGVSFLNLGPWQD
jgi:hypothetical protein